MSELANALNQRGLHYLSLGDHSRAIPFFQAAASEDVTLADAHTNLGVALFMKHDFDAAVVSLNKSLSLRPDHAETLLNLGYGLWRLNDLPGAIAALERAIALKDLGTAHIALGSVYWEVGEDEKAIYHCREGLKTEPDNILAYDTLREVYHFRGCEADALAICDAMIERWKDQTHIHKKSIVMLTYGNPAGWPTHEIRYERLEGVTKAGLEDPKWFRRLFGKRWDGSPTDHLVVATEQGYGDVIQALRYLPLVAERCRKLSLHIPATLRSIVQQSFNIPNLVVGDDEFPDEFDHWCLTMSLPYLLKATDRIPGCPYLRASTTKYGEIRRLPGPRIGLCWAGSKELSFDRWRSMPFETMTPLLDTPASFVSLQFPSPPELRTFPITVVHPNRGMFSGKLEIDWTETAALIDALDLVISVDTAVAHLAGALGKPVWLLNRYNTDWRWGLKGSETRWYPTMRLYRQEKMGDWRPVIEQVVADLLKFSSSFLETARA